MIKKIFKTSESENKRKLKNELIMVKEKLIQTEFELFESKQQFKKIASSVKSNKMGKFKSDIDQINESKNNSNNDRSTSENSSDIDPDCCFHRRLFVMYDLIDEFASESKFMVAISIIKKAIEQLSKIRCDNHPEMLLLKGKLIELEQLRKKFFENKKNKNLSKSNKSPKNNPNFDHKINSSCNKDLNTQVFIASNETIKPINFMQAIENFSGKDLEKAEKMTINIIDDLIRIHDKNHINVSTMMDCLAKIYYKTNRFEESLNVAIESMKIKINLFGETHLEVGRSLSFISIVYANLNQNEKSIESSKKAMKIKEINLGENHYFVGVELNNLAMRYQAMKTKNYDEIEQLLLRALKIFKSFQIKDHLNLPIQLTKFIKNMYFEVASNLSTVYNEQGKFNKSSELIRTNLRPKASPFEL